MLTAIVVVAAAGLAFLRLRGGPEPLHGPERSFGPALRAGADPARGSIRLVDSGRIVSGPDVELEIAPPLGATEMQVGFDPTFTSTPWQPVVSSLTLSVHNVGHQMLFGRFRGGPGQDPTEVSVDAVEIDPTYAVATSSVDGQHQASWVRPLSTTSVMVRIEAGRLQRGRQQPYDFDAPPDGDEVKRWFGPTTVERDGEPYGRQVDGNEGMLRPYDRLIGRPLDGERLTAGRWTLTDVAASGSEVDALDVARISRPSANGQGPDGRRVTSLVHDVVLQFPVGLRSGTTYLVTPPDGLVEPIEFVWDPDVTISPTVHVNQNGYGPHDPFKAGYVSGLFDGMGALLRAEGTPFRVIDIATGRVAGEGRLTARPGGDEFGQGDLTGSAVFEADFSTLADSGRFRLCVDGIGCSEDFSIDDGVWSRLTTLIARSMYHQRSGTALGPPYTSVARPRPYHPDDGLVVMASDLSFLDTFDLDGSELFEELVNEGVETPVPEAWGGHFDAGDWDRRAQHLFYVRAVAELLELEPERLAALDLGIPESGDAIPDLLDEGLWTLDLYRRMQGPDGAIRGGVEASEHPQPDTTSWTDQLAVFAFAPDPWSSYLYAGVAAQVAAVLEPYDRDRAEDYAESAERAFGWAETRAQQPDSAEPDRAEQVEVQRSVAAAALFKLTGEGRYHDVFVETTTLGDGVDPLLSCAVHGACDAGWIYLTTDPARTDPDLRAMIEQSFVATADAIVAAAETTSFGWAVENRFAPLVWGSGLGGSPSGIALLRAYELTGDGRYRAAGLRSAAVSLGANPLNTVYLTGVGRNPARSPLIVDVLNGGLPVWSGTPVYGNHRLNELGDEHWIDQYVLAPAGVWPSAEEVPYLWQWFDVADVAMFNEYTVFQSHAEAIYTYTLLAAAEG